MSFIGTWRNQYGSLLSIGTEKDGVVSGTFETALSDSGFFGQVIPVHGVYDGPCIGISGAGKSAAGSMAVSYTGLLRDGRLETLWFVVSDANIAARAEGEIAAAHRLPWWRAMSISSDTFERVESMPQRR